ncbi:hypothetical protein [Nodularia chucula]|uniref:hypothetical protein n=1 Tax=Nodularia chucula TaxID=3093667 RepID=UPI0039C5EE2B
MIKKTLYKAKGIYTYLKRKRLNQGIPPINPPPENPDPDPVDPTPLNSPNNLIANLI